MQAGITEVDMHEGGDEASDVEAEAAAALVRSKSRSAGFLQPLHGSHAPRAGPPFSYNTSTAQRAGYSIGCTEIRVMFLR